MNGVRVARLTKKMKKKDVLAAAGGILTPQLLNQIEARKEWRPRSNEELALAAVLNVPLEVLFASGLRIDLTYGTSRKPKVRLSPVNE
jgi:hypothetical protein